MVSLQRSWQEGRGGRREEEEEGPTGGAVWEAMASAIAKQLARIRTGGT